MSSTEPAVELELDNEQAAHGSLAKVHPFVGDPATPSPRRTRTMVYRGRKRAACELGLLNEHGERAPHCVNACSHAGWSPFTRRSKSA